MQQDIIRNSPISIKYKPIRVFLTPFIKKILEYLFITVTDGDIILTKKTVAEKADKAYVLYATESYYETVSGCVASFKP